MLDAAVLLIVGIKCRHHLDDLHKVTGIPKDKLKVWKQNLIKNGIWTGPAKGNRTYSNWFDEETGGTCFLLDVLAALGLVEKVP